MRANNATQLADRLEKDSFRSLQNAIRAERCPLTLNELFNRIAHIQMLAVEKGESAAIGQLNWRELNQLLALLKVQENKLERTAYRRHEQRKRYIATFGKHPTKGKSNHEPTKDPETNPESTAERQRKRRSGRRKRNG